MALQAETRLSLDPHLALLSATKKTTQSTYFWMGREKVKQTLFAFLFYFPGVFPAANPNPVPAQSGTCSRGENFHPG